MIKRMTHVTIWVYDQDEALEFYTKVLGFELKTNAEFAPGKRWITVSPKGQDLELILMDPRSVAKDPADAELVRELVKRGVLGPGAFTTDDVRGTYDALRGQGVEFSSPPTERFYGIETVMRDNQGNWFSVTQPTQGQNQH